MSFAILLTFFHNFSKKSYYFDVIEAILFRDVGLSVGLKKVLSFYFSRHRNLTTCSVIASK